MAGYQVNRHLGLQLNANNIFDRTYYSSIAHSVSYGGDTYGNPRNLMLTARYSFQVSQAQGRAVLYCRGLSSPRP